MIWIPSGTVDEQQRVVLDRFRPAAVYPEVRLDGDPLAVVVLTGHQADRVFRVISLHAVQIVVDSGQFALSPIRFKDRLSDADAGVDTVIRLHLLCGRGDISDEVGPLIIAVLRDFGNDWGKIADQRQAGHKTDQQKK